MVNPAASGRTSSAIRRASAGSSTGVSTSEKIHALGWSIHPASNAACTAGSRWHRSIANHNCLPAACWVQVRAQASSNSANASGCVDRPTPALGQCANSTTSANNCACSCATCRLRARTKLTRSSPPHRDRSIPANTAANTGPGAITSKSSGTTARSKTSIPGTLEHPYDKK